MNRPKYADPVLWRITRHRGRPGVGQGASPSIPPPPQATEPKAATEVIDPIAAAVERLFALSDERTFMSDSP